MKIAINGFGRIGRAALKIALERGIDVVAINDLGDIENMAYLLKYDSVYGGYSEPVDVGDREIIVSNKKIEYLSEKDPYKLPWEELEIDVVLECTGIFRTTKDAKAHISAGAKKVIISAPAKDKVTKTYVIGVNDNEYKNDEIINNASCTTNCIAPVAKIINDAFGVKKAMMSTVHAYTADQSLVDGPHKDARRGRTAGENIIPTTTGAAQATTETIPGLKGKFDGMAIRVPVACGSLADFTFLLEKKVTEGEVNSILVKACDNLEYKNVVMCTTDPIVSSDVIGNNFSSIVDLSLTKVVDGDMVKVVAWYDNEWGYANRLVELAEKIVNHKL